MTLTVSKIDNGYMVYQQTSPFIPPKQLFAKNVLEVLGIVERLLEEATRKPAE